MTLMNLKILFNDNSKKEIKVKRFSDISTEKSKYYYYEQMNDIPGKGTCISRSTVKCIEIE